MVADIHDNCPAVVNPPFYPNGPQKNTDAPKLYTDISVSSSRGAHPDRPSPLWNPDTSFFTSADTRP